MKVETFGIRAVTAKYLPVTDHRPSRIKVRLCDHQQGDRTLTVSWDHALDQRDNFAKAVAEYARLVGWDDGDWAMAGSRDGYVAVFTGVTL